MVLLKLRICIKMIPSYYILKISFDKNFAIYVMAQSTVVLDYLHRESKPLCNFKTTLSSILANKRKTMVSILLDLLGDSHCTVRDH